MFERFTDQARSAIVAATEEARALGHQQLGTEHVLLGLLHDPTSVSGRAFASLGVSLDDTRARVASTVHDATAPDGPESLTSRAKQLLELSGREAVRHGRAEIGTGDLALALLRERDGTAVRVLSELGVERAPARARVLELLSTEVEPTSRPTPAVVSYRQLSPQTQDLRRKALGLGSTYVARRYLPGLMRNASTTARVARQLGWNPQATPTNRRDPQRELEPAPTAPSLVPAACSFCGRQSPECGTLYAGANRALICEHCVDPTV
jgi:ATP-dependent Clp protease ATP-binding subunit ClpA